MGYEHRQVDLTWIPLKLEFIWNIAEDTGRRNVLISFWKILGGLMWEHWRQRVIYMLKGTINCNYNNFFTTISPLYLLKYVVEKIEWLLGAFEQANITITELKQS